MNIQLLKSLDRWLGSTLARLLSKPPAPSSKAPPESILLIRPGGIGDAVHLVPAIHALQQKFPDVAIDILAEVRNAGTFQLCPGIRQVYLYDRLSQLLRALRNRYDVVIDTEQWHRLSAVVARLVKAPMRIGYATNERERLLTHGIVYSHEDYEVESFLQLLAPLGIAGAAAPGEAWLKVPTMARAGLESILPDLGSGPFVALFPGASIAERCWGAQNFRAVAQWCGARGLRAVVVGGPGERAEGECIAAGLDNVFNLAGRTSLAETAAVLERAEVVVSGDSGVLHIAVGLGRPTVSLFGAGIAAKWAPRGPDHLVINRQLPCSPCTRFGYTPPCPTASCCMKEITPGDVVDAVAALLAHSSEKGKA